MKYVVIVDGYRAGEQFFNAFKAHNIQCIHVKSQSYKEDGLFTPIDPQNYVAEMEGDLSDILPRLRPYSENENKIIGVIAGIDAGTVLTDHISHELGLETSNGIENSEARRDKFLMVQALNRLNPGIKTVSHCKSNDIGEILAFIEALPAGTQYPIVLKPTNSGGSQNVFICHNQAAVQDAFDTIIHSENVFEQQINDVLVQTFLKGREFMVNGVCCDGEYVCTDIWEYTKTINENGRPLYNYEDALPIEGQDQKALVAYVQEVLHTLGVKYGVTHVEVMLTDEGPVLVEMAARVCGCKKKDLYHTIYGINPFDMTVLAYSNPDAFREAAAARRTDELLQHARHANILIPSGRVIHRVIDHVSLPSLFDNTLPNPGEIIKNVSEDLLGTADLILVHESEAQIKADYTKVTEQPCVVCESFSAVTRTSVIAESLGQSMQRGLFSVPAAAHWSVSAMAESGPLPALS